MEQYIKLNTASNIRLQLTAWAKTTTDWQHKSAFDYAIVPLSLITEEPLTELMQKFRGTPVIFRMPPWQFYRFHTDAARSCAINMLLEGTDSTTYYGTDTADEEVLDIVELKYKTDGYYLLNRHQKHCVVNRDYTRYMFSLGFPDRTEYRQVRDYCLEHKL